MVVRGARWDGMGEKRRHGKREEFVYELMQMVHYVVAKGRDDEKRSLSPGPANRRSLVTERRRGMGVSTGTPRLHVWILNRK